MVLLRKSWFLFFNFTGSCIW